MEIITDTPTEFVFTEDGGAKYFIECSGDDIFVRQNGKYGSYQISRYVGNSSFSQLVHTIKNWKPGPIPFNPNSFYGGLLIPDSAQGEIKGPLGIKAYEALMYHTENS